MGSHILLELSIELDDEVDAQGWSSICEMGILFISIPFFAYFDIISSIGILASSYSSRSPSSSPSSKNTNI